VFDFKNRKSGGVFLGTPLSFPPRTIQSTFVQVTGKQAFNTGVRLIFQMKITVYLCKLELNRKLVEDFLYVLVSAKLIQYRN
jgi:hypothetical protein